MIGYRAVIGLSLLCALLFSAFAAQSASAKGTTAFTCVAGTGSSGFEDEHCDKATNEKAKVKFVHSEIAPKTETAVTGTNEKTASETKASTTATFISVRAGVTVHIDCTGVHSEGTLTNSEVTGKMQAAGPTTVTYTGCTVTKPINCTVNSPKKPAGTIETEKLTAKTKIISEAPEEMGVEVTPNSGTFVSLEFSGEKCAFKGLTFPIAGSVIGTPGNEPNGHGATLWFSATAQEEKEFGEGKSTAMQKLTFGGSPALYKGVETLKMVEGNPITLTTTAN
jgi:hypothetical protein